MYMTICIDVRLPDKNPNRHPVMLLIESEHV
jgi:hypothetical protein